MPETTVALFVALVLFGVALMALLGGRSAGRRLAATGARLQAANERLVADAPHLAKGFAAQREGLARVSAGTERALWSLARFDERLEATRAALIESRTELDHGRARLISARANIARLKRAALTLIRMMELRRAILG